MTAIERTPANPANRPILIEVAILFTASLLVLAVSEALSALGGLVAENRGILTAAFLLLVPIAVLRWRDLEPADLGIGGFGVKMALMLSALTAIIVFPPYTIGFEAWSRLTRGHGMSLPEYPLADFPVAMRGRPDLSDSTQGVHVWTEADRLYVVSAVDRPVDVSVNGCAGPWKGLNYRKDLQLLQWMNTADAMRLDPDKGRSCDVGSSWTVDVEVAGPTPILQGQGAGRVSGPLKAERSPIWLFELMLLQLVVVALPEEVFFRGYVQGRLKTIFRSRFRFLGADIGWHVVLASVLFALSHLVLVPAPFRLAVFFPGLLFGFLKERTGGILAPAIVHAASNVLLAVLQRYAG